MAEKNNGNHEKVSKIKKIESEDKPMSNLTQLSNNEEVDFSEAIELSQIGFWKFSFSNKRLYFSKKAKQILDLPHDSEQVDIEHITSKISPDDYNKLDEFRKHVFESKNPFTYMFHIVLNDGSSRYIEVKAQSKHNEKSEPNSVSGTITDISDKYFQTNKLKDNESLFKSLFNNYSDIFIVFEPLRDKENNIVDYIYRNVNLSFELKFETSKNEIINKKLSSQPEIFQLLHTYFKITALTHEAQQNRFYIESLDSFMDILIYSPADNIVATVWNDVSLMVKTDSSLRESEEKHRQMFNISSDGILLIDFNSGEIIDTNPAGCSITGYQKEELLKLTLNKLQQKNENILQSIFKLQLQHLKIDIQKKDGTIIPCEASLAYFNWSGRKVTQLSLRNIAHQIKAQKQLIFNEKKYKQLFKYSNDAVFVLKNYRITDYNQKSIDLFGIDETELINKTLWNISPIQQKNGEDSRLLFIENMQQTLQGKQLHFECFFQKKNRGMFYADIKLSPFYFDNETYIQAIIRDISPQKHVENALILKEQRWKHALDTSLIGVWDWNVISNEVFFSKTWKKIIGYENHEIENTFSEFENRIHPDDLAMVYNHIETYLEAKRENFNIIFRLRCKAGNYKWINARGRIFSYDNDGKAERFIGTHLDVSKFMQEKNELESLFSKYEYASDQLKVGFWKLDLRNMILTGTPETFKIFGFEHTSKISLKQIEAIVHPEDQQIFMSQFITKNNEESKSYLFRAIVNNNPLYIHSKSQSLITQNNQLTGFRGIFQNITQLKSEEIEIKEKQNILFNISEKFEHAVLIVQDDEVLFGNEQFEKLCGYNFSEYKEKGEPFVDLVVPEDKHLLMKMHDNVADNNISKEQGEIRILTKHNSLKWISVQISPIRYQARSAVLLIANDITRDKKENLQKELAHQQLKKCIANAPLAMIIVDEHEKVTLTNPEFLSLFKIQSEHPKNISLKSLFSESDYLNIKDAHAAICSGSINIYNTEIITSKNIWVNVGIFPEKNPNKQTKSCFYYFENIDITRKQIDMLTEENFLYKTTFENSTAGIALFKPDGDLIIHNHIFSEIIDPETKEKNTLNFNLLDFKFNHKNLTAQEVFTINKPISFHQQNSSGKIIFYDINITTLLASQAIILIARDISENFKHDKTNIENLKRFETLFEQSPVGTALIDKDRNIILCNSQYAQILGFEKDDLLFKKIDLQINSDNLTNIISKLSELYAGVTPHFQLSTKMLHQQKQIWVYMSVSAFTDQYNNVNYAIQTIENVTQAKENQNHKLVLEQYKTLNKIGSTYATLFDSYLKSNYINAYRLITATEKAQNTIYSEKIIKATALAHNLNNQLIAFSYKNEKIKTYFDVVQIVKTLVENLNSYTNVNTTVYSENNIEQILADPQLIKTALENIISNAYEAIPNEGEIKIKVDSVFFDNEQTLIDNEIKKGKFVRIQISDTGKGMSSSNIENSHNPFFTTKLNEHKYGMGLTVARKIIKEHGGYIKIESKRNSGTNVYLYIPVVDIENGSELPKPNEILTDKGIFNIIIIEDEQIVREISAALLKKMGCNVYSFSSPSEAIAFYKENNSLIDFLIIDNTLPNTDLNIINEQLYKIKPVTKIIQLNTVSNINEKPKESANKVILNKPISIEKLTVAFSDLLNKE